MKFTVAPWLTVCGVDGLIVPLPPLTLGVTVCVSIAKLAITVQSAVTAFVVYVVPTRLPPQVPVTFATWKFGDGDSVKHQPSTDV
ncbi:MAG TPA: hypothetical protein VFS55_16650 [Dokdonella sp.]|nr:hypothetical protein [Dokdonella sp.]